MTNASPPHLLVMLAGDDHVGRVVVSLESFLDFSQDVTNVLEDLETDWLHAAAPIARQRAPLFDRGWHGSPR
jgi:hypothetical protein